MLAVWWGQEERKGERGGKRGEGGKERGEGRRGEGKRGKERGRKGEVRGRDGEGESRERVSKHYDMKILTVLSVVKAWVRLFCSSNTTTQKLTHTHTRLSSQLVAMKNVWLVRPS